MAQHSANQSGNSTFRDVMHGGEEHRLDTRGRPGIKGRSKAPSGLLKHKDLEDSRSQSFHLQTQNTTMATKQCQGSSVIITGSAGGLGKDIAKAYLEAGANVTLCDINQERLDATAAEWKDVYAEQVLTVKVDVTDETSVAALVAATVARFGRLDILVNNAGIMDLFDPVGSCTKEMWDKVLAVNLTGPFLVTKAAVNQFLAQGRQDEPAEPATQFAEGDAAITKDTADPGTGGLIIHIGSTASYRGLASGVAYTTSKHGLLALTRNTAFFYADRGIYSVALLLGVMLTTNISDGMAASYNKDAFTRCMGAQPEFKPGATDVKTESVARYCVFLSDREMAASANGSCNVFNRNFPPI